MKKSVYSIRDCKMESFGIPVLIENDSVAIRQFGDIITKGNDNLMSIHPSDFALYKLGDFDPVTGKFINLDCPVILANGADFGNKKDA